MYILANEIVPNPKSNMQAETTYRYIVAISQPPYLKERKEVSTLSTTTHFNKRGDETKTTTHPHKLSFEEKWVMRALTTESWSDVIEECEYTFPSQKQADATMKKLRHPKGAHDEKSLRHFLHKDGRKMTQEEVRARLKIK